MKKLNLSYLALTLEAVNDAFEFHSLSFFNSIIYLCFISILEGYSQPKKIAPYLYFTSVSVEEVF